MKKVLHVLRCFSNGGTEKYVINLLKETYKQYENIILVYDDVTCWEKELAGMNINIIRIDNPKKQRLINFIKNLRKVIRENEIDIVYSYTHYNSAIVMLCAYLEKVKIRITHSHRSSSEQKQSLKYYVYMFFSKLLIHFYSTDKLACSSEAGNDLFFNNYKIINNGIELDKYLFNKNLRFKIRESLDISKDCHVIGMIGRLDENKNVTYMINVFAEYCKCVDNSKLILIGDGNQKNNLILYAREKGIEDIVCFLGVKKNANEYYNAFDLYTITSFKEGLPFVLIEAQTNGLKCLASDTVDKMSNITNNVTFLPLNDVELWVESIINNINKRYNCIKAIENSGFSLSESIKEVIKIYERK